MDDKTRLKMIRSQLCIALSRGASSHVCKEAWKRSLASKAKRSPGGTGRTGRTGGTGTGSRSSTRAAKENKAPRIQRLPKLSKEASAALLPQANVPVPPAYLSATASPNVYVAKCATEEFQIDPRSLFDEQKIPPSFRKAEFHYMSPKLFDHELPKYKIPEVAVLGRSNVGKSSLINATMRKKLARASKRPGRTQTVHYYGLMPSGKNADTGASAALGFLIDLPGYGFAKAPDSNVSQWQEMTQNFLLSRRDKGTLTRTFMLIDARRGVSQFDRNIMGWFDEAEIPYSVVVTKADCVSLPQIVRFTNDICMRYHSQLYQGNGSQGPIVHVTSSSKNRGIEELMASVDAEFTGFYDDSEVGFGEEAPDEDESEEDCDDEESTMEIGMHINEENDRHTV